MQPVECTRESRICPKGLKVCCRFCEYKENHEECNGDKDFGCGEWEIVYYCKDESEGEDK